MMKQSFRMIIFDALLILGFLSMGSAHADCLQTCIKNYDDCYSKCNGVNACQFVCYNVEQTCEALCPPTKKPKKPARQNLK